MGAIATSLPPGFEALAPFVEFWAVGTASERAHCRDISDEASRVAFYNAAIDLVPQALAHLDAKPLNQFNESEQRLMRLVLSFGHVAMAVELQREEEPRHARNRPYLRITRATADQEKPYAP
jgi:hypothetical protein